MRLTALPVLLLTGLTAACTAQPAERPTAPPAGQATPTTAHPRPDVGSGVLYEANVRLMTPEGTLDALTEQIPRLADLHVRVLWLMPIHPVGEVKRVGTLGSPYAAADFLEIDPALGTKEDLDELVAAAHARDMLVILDWVPNHTAWDHVWTVDHPEYFVRDEDGGFVPPRPEWQDVIELDFDNPDTRAAMTDAMRYWVEEHAIDGFRCDHAEGVPEDYWREAIAELRTVKPLFMLAEGHQPWLAEAGFDAMYGWGLGDAVLGILRKDGGAERVGDYLNKWVVPLTDRPGSPFRVHFTSQHDWNAWEGPAKERFGPALDATTVLSYLLPGMPLIYNGQEAGLDRRLGFFDKDTIEWKDDPAADLYRKLGALKARNPALQHGNSRGKFVPLTLGEPERVVSFMRRAGNHAVIVAVNLSPEWADLRARRSNKPTRDLDGNPATLPDILDPWGWVILEQQDP